MYPNEVWNSLIDTNLIPGEEYGVNYTLLNIILSRNIFQEKFAELLLQYQLYQVMSHPRVNTAGVGFVLYLRKALKITPEQAEVYTLM